MGKVKRGGEHALVLRGRGSRPEGEELGEARPNPFWTAAGAFSSSLCPIAASCAFSPESPEPAAPEPAGTAGLAPLARLPGAAASLPPVVPAEPAASPAGPPVCARGSVCTT